MNARRPYVRSMDGWWRRHPFYREYMLHEGIAFLVALYAGLLIAGLWQLREGREAWLAWVAWLKHPSMLCLHAILLLGFAYHSWSWFHILPRTMRPLKWQGRRVNDRTVVRLGLAAALIVNLLVAVGFAYVIR